MNDFLASKTLKPTFSWHPWCKKWRDWSVRHPGAACSHLFGKQSQKNAEMWNEMCVGMLPVPTLSRWNRAKGWLDPPRLFTIPAFWQVTSDHLAGVFHYKYQAGCEKRWTRCSHFGIHLPTNQKTFNRVVSCSFVWNVASGMDGEGLV